MIQVSEFVSVCGNVMVNSFLLSYLLVYVDVSCRASEQRFLHFDFSTLLQFNIFVEVYIRNEFFSGFPLHCTPILIRTTC